METSRVIPYYKGKPIIGHLIDIQWRRLEFITKMCRACGDIGAFHFGSMYVVVVTSPEYAKAILVEHPENFERSPVMVQIRPIFGNGLLTSDNILQKRQRKLLAPTFQHRRVASYADAITTSTMHLVENWKDNTVIDIAREMMFLTLRSISQVLFEVDIKAEEDELSQAFSTVLGHIFKQAGSSLPIPLTWPTPGNQRFKKGLNRLNETVYRTIERRRQQGDLERGDFLSTLLTAKDENGNTMSDEQMRDEVITMYLAGHDTTASALAWTWYLLATHPQVYQKMEAELQSVLDRRIPTYEDLAQLPYTLQVLKESMRLYPPAYIIGRTVKNEFEMDGYVIPADTIINVYPYEMHHRADYFPDPERFYPERFSPELEKQLPHGVYLPFGDGPRICIGNHFAQMQAHLILATITQQFTFQLVDGQTIEPAPLITLQPRNGIKVVVHRKSV